MSRLTELKEATVIKNTDSSYNKLPKPNKTSSGKFKLYIKKTKLWINY